MGETITTSSTVVPSTEQYGRGETITRTTGGKPPRGCTPHCVWLRPERVWLRPECVRLRPEGVWLRPECVWLRPECVWLRPECVRLRPAWGATQIKIND